MDTNQILAEYDSMFGRCTLSEIELFLQQNIDRAESMGEYGVMIILLNEMIGFCRDTTQREKAFTFCDSLMEIMNRLNLQGRVEYATSLLNIANAYRAFGFWKESLALYEQVYENYRVNVEPKAFAYASLYNNWSLVYQEMEEFEKAKELLIKALQIVDLYEEAVIPQANTRTNLAVTLLNLPSAKAYEEAMGYLKEALEVYEHDGGKDFHYSAALVAMGDAYVSKREYKQAKVYYQRGMKEIEKHVGRTDNYRRVEEKLKHCIACLQNILSSDALQVETKNTSWIKNLARCKMFYEKYGKPMLQSKFSEYEERIAVGLVGEGSDCFGFDDCISTDHDYAIGFCMWLREEDYREIGEELQMQYEMLLKEYGDLPDYHPFLDRRRGVFSINAFYNEMLSLNINFEEAGKNWTCLSLSMTEWLSFEESALATITNGELFRDDLGLFTHIRQQFADYYPDKIWRMRLSKSLHDFSQYAQSNYSRMMARKDWVTASVCVGKALESAMDIAHLLNDTYAPYYKWKKKNMESFLRLSGMLLLLEKISLLPSQKAAWEGVPYDAAIVNEEDEVVCLFEQIARMILQELKRQNMVSGENTFLERYCQQIIKGKNMDVIEQIVDLEWHQFDKVKNEGGRAECQDDFATFSVMRKSQYLTWNEELLHSYRNDLLVANRKGWNLIMEKYARMMRSTAPEKYANMEKELPVLNDRRMAIQEEIIRIQVSWMEDFAARYPKMADSARSIHTSEDSAYNTSYETYLRGELSTYSENTFVLYGRFIAELMQEGKNLAYETMTNTAKLYGYASVEDAEQKMW